MIFVCEPFVFSLDFVLWQDIIISEMYNRIKAYFIIEEIIALWKCNTDCMKMLIQFCYIFSN